MILHRQKAKAYARFGLLLCPLTMLHGNVTVPFRIQTSGLCRRKPFSTQHLPLGHFKLCSPSPNAFARSSLRGVYPSISPSAPAARLMVNLTASSKRMASGIPPYFVSVGERALSHSLRPPKGKRNPARSLMESSRIRFSKNQRF